MFPPEMCFTEKTTAFHNNYPSNLVGYVL